MAPADDVVIFGHVVANKEFRNAKIKITIVTLITSYTNLVTLKLVQHSSAQTLIHFTRTLLIFRFVITSMGSMSL